MNYTEAQKNAINVRGRNVLVSAAAGSGKTATLTQRIISLLTDRESPADVSGLLVVTFTRAAAAELRSRISAALSAALADDPGNMALSRQLTSLGSAKICTIDSYYNSIVKENFQRLGLSSSFRLADEAELHVLQNTIMEDVVERRYATDENFTRFADAISQPKSDDSVINVLRRLYKALQYDPRGIACLRNYGERYVKDSEKDFRDTFAGKATFRLLASRFEEDIRFISSALKDAESDAPAYKGLNVSRTDHEFITSLYYAVKNFDYEGARRVLIDYSPLRFPGGVQKSVPENIVLLKDFHEYCKKTVAESLFKKFFSLRSEQLGESMIETGKFCLTVYDALADFELAYEEEKKARNVVEFTDLKRYVMKLFISPDGSPTGLALAERKKFSHIFIDEEQDTDSIQDAIFRAVSNGRNMFMVGDIKQSIYEFRGAEPDLFGEYRRRFPIYDPENSADGEPCSIFMSENFRSGKNIISFANAVCSYLFTITEDPDDPKISYKPEDNLNYARPGNDSEEPVRIVIFNKPEKQKDSKEKNERIPTEVSLTETGTAENSGSAKEKVDPETEFVINEIRRLLRDGKNPDSTPIKPDDIAVIARKNDQCAVFADALSHAGIPAVNMNGEEYFKNTEVQIMVSLLTAADNPRRDIPLTAALRSPLFRFTLSDLVTVRLGRKDTSLYDALIDYYGSSNSDPSLADKCRDTVAKIDRYRTMAEAMPVHRFVRALWKECNVLSYAGTDDSENETGSPLERRLNLNRLYEFARTFEASSFRSLHDFVTYIGRIIDFDQKIKSEVNSTSGYIRVMTAHKSKGLEFPVVFLVNTGKSYKHTGTSDVFFTTDADLGLTMKTYDRLGKANRIPPFYSTSTSLDSIRSAEEELRVLYVALTRARDRLIIVSSGKKIDSGILSSYRELGCRNRILDLDTWIELILTSTDNGMSAAASACSKVEFREISESTSAHSELEERVRDEERISELADELSRRFAFNYEACAGSSIPAKLSVSRLYPDVLSEDDGDEIAVTSAMIRKAENMEPRVPRFMGGKDTAAEKGTATHLFLQFCDFSLLDGTVGSAREEAARLTQKSFIPSSAAELVRFDEIAAFARSDFFKSLKNALEVHRETRFNIFLPAADFTTDPAVKAKLGNEKLMVQGVIDLFFTDSDGKLVLCDYKTDRLSAEERRDPALAAKRMSEIHGTQLSYYSAAIEQMMGRKPDRICIFSLHLGQTVDINI